MTATAVKVNVPLLFPAAMVIVEAERVTAVLEDVTATVSPAEGAAPFKVTVPVTDVPSPP